MADYKYSYREVPDDPELNTIWRAETLEYAVGSRAADRG